jgi:hypothetical protein
MKMIKALVILCGLWFGNGASATPVSLQNGDFENGLTGWNSNPPFFTIATDEIGGLTAPDDGNFASLTAFFDAPTTLTQSVSLHSGDIIAFDFAIPGGGNPNGAFFLLDGIRHALSGVVDEWRHFDFQFTGNEGVHEVGIGVEFQLGEPIFIENPITGEGQWVPSLEGLGYLAGDKFTIERPSSVPEPGIIPLLLFGAFSLLITRRNNYSSAHTRARVS